MAASPARTKARPPGRARTTPRDLLILRLVAQAGVVEVRHVVALASVSLAIARRRLRVLRDLGLVTVVVPHQNAASQYVLTWPGAVALARIEGRSPEDYRVLKSPPKDPLGHRAAIVDVVVAFEVACARSRGAVNLLRTHHEWELRAATRAERGTLVPDAMLELNVSGARVVLVIEVDTGSERAAWFGTNKAAPLAAMAHAGGTALGSKHFSVLVLARSMNRLQKLALETVDAPSGLFRFAVLDRATPDSVLTKIWYTLRVANDEASFVAAPPFPPPDRSTAPADGSATPAPARRVKP